MIYKSPFVFVKHLDEKKEFVFSSQSQKVYAFKFNLEDVIHVADKYPLARQKLGKLGLISRTNNYDEAVSEFEEKKIEKNSTILRLVYNVTTKCGLDCKYCFQNHLERRDTTTETIKKTGELLDGMLSANKNFKLVNLYLFGGDPILRPDLCMELLSVFRKICKTKRVRLFPTMATNGLFKDYDAYKALNKSGLKNLQISFDGPKYIHNKTRKDSYDAIMKNIPILSEFFVLSIKYNIHKENIHGFREFLKDIKSIRFSRPYTITLEALHKTSTYEGQSHLYNYEDEALAEAVIELADLCARNNVPYDICAFFEPPCMATSPYSFMIEPEGKISNCITAYNIEDFSMGHVYDTRSFNFLRDDFNMSVRKAADTICRENKCPFFPVCETGCFYQKRLNGIDFSQPLCRHKFYSKLVDGLIELKAKEWVKTAL
ncbi:MAG: radical SAM protein [Elusimicrobia bacterium]|nr:radical SAM protein [Elusimicrobiota bacterium]